MFEYCEYIMIIGYFDNIHFDLFHNQDTKKAIYSTKKSKVREFVRKICDKDNLYNFFGEKNKNSDYEMGWESFLMKHENAKTMNKTNYISNKWLDVADGVEVAQDRVYKYQAVVLCHKETDFDIMNCTPYIRATPQKTNEVKFYDIT